MMKQLFLSLASAILIAGVAHAQLDVGADAPEIKAAKISHSKANSMADFKGKLVFVEYFAHW